MKAVSGDLSVLSSENFSGISQGNFSGYPQINSSGNCSGNFRKILKKKQEDFLNLIWKSLGNSLGNSFKKSRKNAWLTYAENSSEFSWKKSSVNLLGEKNTENFSEYRPANVSSNSFKKTLIKFQRDIHLKVLLKIPSKDSLKIYPDCFAVNLSSNSSRTSSFDSSLNSWRVQRTR